MAITARQLALIVALAAIVASIVTYTIATVTQPALATASDTQIATAVKNAIGTSEYDSNSLRNDLRKQLNTLGDTIGGNEFEGVRGEIHTLCRAIAAEPISC